MIAPRSHETKGFTLVEVIATLLVASILGVIFVNFMGSSLKGSARSVDMVRGEADAEATMEQIIGDYVRRLNQYTSSADPEPLGLVKTDVDNNVYGTSVSATYISFDTGGNEVASADATPTLKVQVAASGNDLITLLTKSRNPSSPPVPY